MICAASELRFATAAPSAMHSIRELRFIRSATPSPTNKKPHTSARRLLFLWKNRMGIRSRTPRSAPTASAARICPTGTRTERTGLPPLPDMPAARAEDTEKRISAVASSIATTDRSVEVTGPFALY